MKNALLLVALMFTLDVSSMSLSDYSENGIRLDIKNHAVGTFTLVSKEGGDIGIVERQFNEGIKILSKKVVEAETMVSLRGKDGGNDKNMVVYLQFNGENLLTFTFKLDPKSGRQLYLESVKGESKATTGVGVFRKIGGGGITYQLIIDKDKEAIEMFESKQRMCVPVRQQERLQKVKIL